MSEVLVRVLGPVEVEKDGEAIASRSTSRRRVLALLAANRGSVVTLGQLTEAIGVTPAAVRTIVSRLRNDLGEGIIITNSVGYSIDPERCDSTLAEHMLDQAREANGIEALDLTGVALGLWRGPAFGDLANEPWAEAESARLEEMATTAREAQADLLILLRRPDEAIALLRAQVINDPLREHPRRSLMTALDQSGRTTEALRQYQAFRQSLAEVGTEPSQAITALEHAIASGTQTHKSATPVMSKPPNPVDSPAAGAISEPVHIHSNGNRLLAAEPTNLVGRRHDRSAVLRTLESSRMLTIMGMGGVGKTSLARAVGSDCLPRFDDGVSIVELARCRDLPSMLSEAAEALGVAAPSSTKGLADAVRGHDLLLILDNCEHMLDAVRLFVSNVISGSDRLRILATSREPIGLDEERVYRLDPLDSTKDAVEIFRRRAAEIGIDVSSADPLVIEEICRRLDKVPLAVELAAATCQLLTPEQIRDRLDRRFETLRGSATSTRRARHGTLRATIDWSYDSLNLEQQVLLRRLSVFNGGFDVDAVEHMANDLETPSLFLLGDLVDRSLVSVLGGRRTRYEQPETIRVYARQRGEERAEIEDSFARHAEWCESHIDRMAAVAFGDGEAAAIGRLVEETPNIRAAMRRLLFRGRTDQAIDLVLRLEDFVYCSNPLAELVAPVIELGVAEGHPARTRLLSMELVRLTTSGGSSGRGELAADLSRSIKVEDPGSAHIPVMLVSGAMGLVDDTTNLGDLRAQARAAVTEPSERARLLAAALVGPSDTSQSLKRDLFDAIEAAKEVDMGRLLISAGAAACMHSLSSGEERTAASLTLPIIDYMDRFPTSSLLSSGLSMSYTEAAVRAGLPMADCAAAVLRFGPTLQGGFSRIGLAISRLLAGHGHDELATRAVGTAARESRSQFSKDQITAILEETRRSLGDVRVDELLAIGESADPAELYRELWDALQQLLALND